MAHSTMSSKGYPFPRRRREIVLSINLFCSDKEHFHLGPGGRFRDRPVDALVSETRGIVESTLPAELREIFGIEVQTRVIAVREGSIIVFFGAVIAGLTVLSRYKSLYESIQLLRKHCSRLMSRMIEREYGGGLSVNVDVEYPTLDNPLRRPFRPFQRFRELFGETEADELEAMFDEPRLRSRQDGFFWFLLGLCLAEGLALVILVWNAVARTYLS